VGGAAEPAAAAEPVAPTLRLPRTFLPLANRARLRLDPARETFEGQIEIEARVSEPTHIVWLHAEQIEVDEAKIVVGGRSWPLEVLSQSGEFVGLRSSWEIPAGTARVTIAYRGRIDEKETKGIFRQKEGEDWYLFTQFEALGARRAYPCFDEPDSKVPWQITLEVPEKLVPLSNTQVASEKATGSGWREVTFRETRPLPSYLVAFAVGPFDVVSAGMTRHGTPMRIVVPRGRGGEVSYVLENTSPILALLEDYFAIPYPFDKLDLLAIPVTVGFGAMENPGLVTFNQRLLVARKEDFTISFRRRFASVVAHELAHQWFGDLVTLAWWDDIWLNEAFASWMGDRVVRQWKPEWSGDVSLVTRRSGAISSDSLQTARKIRQPIQSTHDIENAFDGITYSKGSSVIANFERWMGEEKFREGVRSYMRKHSWGNATAADFLAAVGAAAGRDVAIPFSTFLDQVGAPLIGVELVCEEDRRPRLRLSQERYLPLGSQADRRTTWQVPICVKYPAGKALASDCTLLSERTAEMELSLLTGCPAWILPNAEGIGYHRSELGSEMLEALLDRGMKKVSLPERVGVIGDVNALVGAGRVEVGEALALVERYARDESRHVVSSVSGIADGISDTVPDEMRSNYARFIRKMFGDRARRLGWSVDEDEDDDTRLLRASLLDLVTGEGQDAVLAAEGRKLALAWLDDHASVDPNLVGVALEAAARFGDRGLFDRFLAEAKQAKDRRDRQRLLSALASFRDPELVNRAMSIVLTDQFDIRESSVLLYGGLSEPHTRRQVYDFVKANLDAVLSRMPEQSGRGLIRIGTAQCDASLKPELEFLFKERMGKIQGGPRTYEQALEQLDLCVKRREAQRPGVVSFLKRY
jgi:alanyl aminopeptidase